MVATVTFNPSITTVAAGSFNASSGGFMQGIAYNDPTVRNLLAGGILATTETLPMWGGVAISENTTPQGTAVNLPNRALGGYIARATAIGANGSAGQLTGFSVFDQNNAMVNTPQSPVPLSASGQQVNFYRLGSNARLAVAIDPVLVSLNGGLVTQQVSWDFSAQRLIPYVAAYVAATPSVYNSYTSATGILQLTFAAAPGPLAGSDIVLTGFTGANAVLNGSWTVASTASAGTVLNIQVTIGLGALTPAVGTLAAGGGALPCRVLDVEIGNSMTVSYDPVTGFATWNRAGSSAVILI